MRERPNEEILYKSYRQIMGSTTGCHGLSGAVEVAHLHVEITP
jgi:hypothetical protein